MARIEIDPNYSSPTFSRATASTDLFKKEDVQDLAAALSTHTHGTGKGLPLAADAIPDGSITSSMIADGAVTTSKLEANASTFTLAVAVGALSTTSTSAVAMPGFTLTWPAVGGTNWGVVNCGLILDTDGTHCTIYWQVDGGAWNQAYMHSAVSAGGYFHCNAEFNLGLLTGSHTITIGWSTSSGTLSTNGAVYNVLRVIEVRK